MLDNLRRQIRAEAEATLDKALVRARREAVQALRRAVLSLIGITLGLFAVGYASYAAFIFLRAQFGSLVAASSLAGLLLALAAICVGFAAIVGRRPQEERAIDTTGEASATSSSAEVEAAPRPRPVKPAPIPSPPVTSEADGETQDEARGTLRAVMLAVSEEIDNDTARAVLREGTRQVGGLSALQLGALAAATGFLYAQNAPRRRR